MKHSLTLTRWHKVAERLGTALKESEARVVCAFTATTVSAWNKEGVEQAAAAIASIRSVLARRWRGKPWTWSSRRT